MSNLLNQLTKAVDELDEQEIIESLKTILAHGTNIELRNVDVVNQLFKINEKAIVKLSAEVTAEWAKIESNRKILTNEETIRTLFKLLENTDTNVVYNVIRALGNICYENEEACYIIDKVGIGEILSILKRDIDREDGLITTKTSGLLLNLCISNDSLVRSALKNDIIPILEQLLIKYSKSIDGNQTLTFLLTILNVLSNHLDIYNIPFTENLCQITVDIFKRSTDPEISVLCLEIFHSQAEKDEIKTILAKEGVCELLFDLIEKYRPQIDNEDSRSVLKMACDLIVLVLTGDDCMYLLYNNGCGKIYLNMTTWLDTDDSDLMHTGVLALGNFARKDVHCIQMVENGISKKLLKILSKYNTSTNIADVTLQHALLSTLKNIAIPQQNKAGILHEGLIDVIYPMMKSEHYLVVFKLLGTLRMVIDGQESAALDLVSRKDFIERLIYWCYNSDHLGVRGEVPRLLAWLIKHCHSFKPIKTILDVQDSVKCLVEMISSNHSVMQNEAFYALALLCTGCSSLDIKNALDGEDRLGDKLIEVVIEADIGKNLHFVINKYGEKMDEHTIENLLTLLEQLVKLKAIAEHLNSNNIKQSLAKIRINPVAARIADKLNKIDTYLGSEIQETN